MHETIIVERTINSVIKIMHIFKYNENIILSIHITHVKFRDVCAETIQILQFCIIFGVNKF